MGKVAILIPAYNASRIIEEVLNKIDRNIAGHVIVVNDGSNDLTQNILSKRKDIKLVNRNKNMGYGATSITLYKEALGTDADYFINVHADGAHNPGEIENILKPLTAGDADIVIGNRINGIMNQGLRFLGSRILGAAVFGPMPVYKFLANIVLTKLQNLCYGTNFHSFHCGFRGCSRKALQLMPFDELTGWYQYDTEFLVKANEMGLRIAEVPVSSCYSSKAGSKVPVIRYGMKVLLSAIKYRLQQINDRKQKISNR